MMLPVKPWIVRMFLPRRRLEPTHHESHNDQRCKANDVQDENADKIHADQMNERAKKLRDKQARCEHGERLLADLPRPITTSPLMRSPSRVAIE